MTAATLSKINELKDQLEIELSIIREGYHDAVSEDAAWDYVREIRADLKALTRAR